MNKVLPAFLEPRSHEHTEGAVARAIDIRLRSCLPTYFVGQPWFDWRLTWLGDLGARDKSRLHRPMGAPFLC